MGRPTGSVTRIRHGDGAHETNRALGLTLLLICNSTFMNMPSYTPLLRGDPVRSATECSSTIYNARTGEFEQRNC